MTHWYNIYIYIEPHLHTHAHTIIYIYIMLDLSVSVGLWVDSAPPQPCRPCHPCRRRAKVKLKPQIWRCHPGCMRCLKADDDVRFFLLHEFPAVSEFPNGVVFAIPKFKCYWIHVISLSFSTSKRLYNTYLYILSGGCIHISWCLEIFKSAGLMQPM